MPSPISGRACALPLHLINQPLHFLTSLFIMHVVHQVAQFVNHVAITIAIVGITPHAVTLGIKK